MKIKQQLLVVYSSGFTHRQCHCAIAVQKIPKPGCIAGRVMIENLSAPAIQPCHCTCKPLHPLPSSQIGSSAGISFLQFMSSLQVSPAGIHRVPWQATSTPPHMASKLEGVGGSNPFAPLDMTDQATPPAKTARKQKVFLVF